VSVGVNMEVTSTRSTPFKEPEEQSQHKKIRKGRGEKYRKRRDIESSSKKERLAKVTLTTCSSKNALRSCD